MNKIKRYSLQKNMSAFQSTTSTFKSKRKQTPITIQIRKNFSVSIKYSQQNFSPSPDSYNYSSRKRANESQSPTNPREYWQSITLYSNKKFYETYSKPQCQCSSMCVLFRDNDQVRLQKNKDQKRQIASLTKIMTAFTAIHLCNTYGIKIRDTFVTVQKQASIMEGTSANLRKGDKLLIIDLLYGMLLPSGNDAALALAQYLGKFLSFLFATKKSQFFATGSQKIHEFEEIKDYYDANYKEDSIKLFVFQMNKNCQRIGLKNTKFTNPTGLSDVNNYSTAFEMTKLISFCMSNYILRSIFKKKVYTCTVSNEKMGSNRLIEWRNTNKHLFSIKNCIGVKTGITPGAGPCLSSAYRINGRQVIVVILNSRNIDERYTQAQQIYSYIKSQISETSNEQI